MRKGERAIPARSPKDFARSIFPAASIAGKADGPRLGQQRLELRAQLLLLSDGQISPSAIFQSVSEISG